MNFKNLLILILFVFAVYFAAEINELKREKESTARIDWIYPFPITDEASGKVINVSVVVRDNHIVQVCGQQVTDNIFRNITCPGRR